MKKIAILLMLTSLSLIADNKDHSDKSKKHSKDDDCAVTKKLNEIFEVKDPDKVDNKKAIRKLFEEGK